MESRKPPPDPLYTIQNPEKITSLLFSLYNSNYLYAGTRNGDFYVYNLNIRRSVYNKNPCEQAVMSILELSENLLLVYCRNGLLFKFLKNESNWSYECVYNDSNYTFCKISKSNNYIFVPSNDTSVITCLNINTFNKINTLKPNSEKTGMLMCMEVIDEKYLLTSYENGDLILFDYQTFEQIDVLTVFKGFPLLYFDYSATLNIGIAACSELQICRFFIDINNSAKLNLVDELIELKNPGINCIKIRHSDNKIFATAGWDSRMRIYSLKKAKLLCVLDFHKEAVNILDFSKDNILAAGSNDGLITFWNLYN